MGQTLKKSLIAAAIGTQLSIFQLVSFQSVLTAPGAKIIISGLCSEPTSSGHGEKSCWDTNSLPCASTDLWELSQCTCLGNWGVPKDTSCSWQSHQEKHPLKDAPNTEPLLKNSRLLLFQSYSLQSCFNPTIPSGRTRRQREHC